MEIVAVLRPYHRDPVVSTTSLLMMHLERQQVDLMIAAAGGTIMSVEHDGMVTQGASQDTVRSIRNATRWPVHVTKYPQTRENFLKFVADKVKCHDWTHESRID